jgi:hypothetical protein
LKGDSRSGMVGCQAIRCVNCCWLTRRPDRRVVGLTQGHSDSKN